MARWCAGSVRSRLQTSTDPDDGAHVPQPARWYVLTDGEQTGPFGLRELRDRVLAGSLTPAMWVWADGMAEWRRAEHVPALVPPPEQAPAGWLSSDTDA